MEQKTTYPRLGNILIFGDSYSTFEGYVPEGHRLWYTTAGRPETDVTRVEETWWYPLVSADGCRLVLNSSWSGSTIGHRGYDGEDFSSFSFIGRMEKLAKEGFFEQNTIDTCLVFGGTNDAWCGADRGEPQFSDWKKEDLYVVLPAVSYFFHRLKSLLPGTRMVALINTNFPPEVHNGLLQICEHYDIETVVLEDVGKDCGHPNKAGMAAICRQTAAALR